MCLTSNFEINPTAKPVNQLDRVARDEEKRKKLERVAMRPPINPSNHKEMPETGEWSCIQCGEINDYAENLGACRYCYYPNPVLLPDDFKKQMSSDPRKKVPTVIVENTSLKDFELPPFIHALPKKSELQDLIQAERFRKMFEEIEFIGQGSFGTVYRSTDRLSGELVALKEIRIHLPVDEKIDMMLEFEKCRFKRELVTALKINSKFCVKYQDFWLEMLSKHDIKNEK